MGEARKPISHIELSAEMPHTRAARDTGGINTTTPAAHGHGHGRGGAAGEYPGGPEQLGASSLSNPHPHASPSLSP